MIQEIHFLRAFSVIAVLFYHLQVPYFSYGYLGVDIFFVISGYLTPYILKDFNAISYISKRFLRILPELLIVVSFSVVVFFFLLKPYEYNDFLLSSLTSITQFSYVFFANNLGYFDVDARFQPLIHTWSLGIEFLAYFIVSITLLTNKLRNPYVFAYLFLLLFLFSTAYWQNYFNPFSRLFAFYVGYIFGLQKSLNINIIFNNSLFYSVIFIYAAFLTLDFIEYGSFLFLSWPNYESIIFPFLIVFILSNIKKDILTKNIFGRIISFFGDISYSLYLWHWVIIVASFSYLRNAHLSLYEQIIFFIISVFFATLSNLFFNKFLRKLSIKFYLFFSTSLFLCITALYLTNFQSLFVPEGLKNYKSINHMVERDVCQNKINILEVDFCKSKGSREILLFGDSHALHFYPLLKSVGESPYLVEARFSENDNLHALFKNIEKIVSELSIKKIYISYRFSKIESDQIKLLADNINTSELRDVEISFIRDIPSFYWDPISCYFSEFSKISLFKKCSNFTLPKINYEFVLNSDDPFKLLKDEDLYKRLNFIDTHKKLCLKGECIIEINETIIMRDKNHFNEKLSNEIQTDLYKRIFL